MSNTSTTKHKSNKIKNILTSIVLVGAATGVVYGGLAYVDSAYTNRTRLVASQTFDSLHSPIDNRVNGCFSKLYSLQIKNSYMIEELISEPMMDRAEARWKKDSARILIGIR